MKAPKGITKDSFISDGLVAARDQNGAWGIVDSEGREIIPCRFSRGEIKDILRRETQEEVFKKLDFHDGLAWVHSDDTQSLGVINDIGDIVVPFQYNDYVRLDDGMTLVRRSWMWGYLNQAGQEVIPCVFDDADGFCDGLARVKCSGKWGFINQEGKELTPCLYDNVCCFEEGIASVYRSGKWGFINKEGQEVIPCVYDEADDFKDGFARVINSEKWGFINREGQEIIPCVYDEAMYFFDDYSYFKDGVACLRHSRNWGVINSAGEVVLPFIYTYVDPLVDHLIELKPSTPHERAVHLFDTKKQAVISEEYSEFRTFEDFDNELLIAYRNDKCGVIDYETHEVIPCRYHAIRACHYNENRFIVAYNDKHYHEYWGVIDDSGNVIIPNEYDEINELDNGNGFLARLKGDNRYFSKSGQLLTPSQEGDNHTAPYIKVSPEVRNELWNLFQEYYCLD